MMLTQKYYGASGKQLATVRFDVDHWYTGVIFTGQASDPLPSLAIGEATLTVDGESQTVLFVPTVYFSAEDPEVASASEGSKALFIDEGYRWLFFESMTLYKADMLFGEILPSLSEFSKYSDYLENKFYSKLDLGTHEASFTPTRCYFFSNDGAYMTAASSFNTATASFTVEKYEPQTVILGGENAVSLRYTVAPLSTEELCYCPLIIKKEGTSPEFTIDWGDGTSETYEPDIDDSYLFSLNTTKVYGATHSYPTSDGTRYQVVVSGNTGDWENVGAYGYDYSGDFYFSPITFGQYVSITFTKEEPGIVKYLVSIDSSIPKIPTTCMALMFSALTHLESVPSSLFSLNPEVTDIRSAFEACSSLASFTLDLTNVNEIAYATDFVTDNSDYAPNRIVKVTAGSTTEATFTNLGSDYVTVQSV